MIATPVGIRHGRAPAFSLAYLERLYPIPRPMLTLEDWRRAHHLDLADFTEDELRWEYRRVQNRSDYERDPAALAWLRGRLVAIRREHDRRHPGQPVPHHEDRRRPALVIGQPRERRS